MNFIKKHLSSFAFLYFILIIYIFRVNLLLPYEGTNSEEIAKEQAAKRSILIEWGTASWSGIILSSDLSGTKILTIVHEESIKKINSSQAKEINIILEGGKKYKASVKRWNTCNELSILTIPSSTLSNLQPIRIESDSSKVSERLFSFGHPLG
jgi:hypothetical protein